MSKEVLGHQLSCVCVCLDADGCHNPSEQGSRDVVPPLLAVHV